MKLNIIMPAICVFACGLCAITSQGSDWKGWAAATAMSVSCLLANITVSRLQDKLNAS